MCHPFLLFLLCGQKGLNTTTKLIILISYYMEKWFITWVSLSFFFFFFSLFNAGNSYKGSKNQEGVGSPTTNPNNRDNAEKKKETENKKWSIYDPKGTHKQPSPSLLRFLIYIVNHLTICFCSNGTFSLCSKVEGKVVGSGPSGRNLPKKQKILDSGAKRLLSLFIFGQW